MLWVMAASDDVTTPSDLARELGVDGLTLRKWLRKEFPRPEVEKYTRWVVTAEQADAARRSLPRRPAT